ncbi:MAG: ABC transporter substrate-binding protein, partial [Pseudomonadota bacterium]
MRILLGCLSVVLATIAIWVMSRDIAPPKAMTIATGIEGGGYWQIAERYREILARDGIEVTLLPTGGALENAQLLAGGAADAGLLQGGIPVAFGVTSLGAMFNEPVQIFTAPGVAMPDNPGAWAGVTFAAGGDGSGTRAAFDGFLAAADLAPREEEVLPLGGAAAVDALFAGQVDAAFFVAPLGAPYLEALTAGDEGLLVYPSQLPAMGRRMRGADVVSLPTGAIRMEPPLPAEDREALVLTAQLGARSGLHPSLVDRLVTAAMEIHGGADAVTEAGAFPSTQTEGTRMHAYAKRL